jgi:hypothetical protein
MSSQNAFPRPNGARPVARPTNPETSRQPSWVNPQTQPGYAPQPANHWPPQDDAGFQGGGYQGGGFAPQQGYGQPAPQNPDYGHWSELQPGHHNNPGQAQTDPYAPQFEPYVPPSRGAGGRQPGLGNGQQPAPQWPGQGGADPNGFDAGNYGAAPGYASSPGHGGPAFGGEQSYREPELSASDWAGQPGEFGSDPYQDHGDDLGFAQAEGGELDAYGEDDGDYEDEEAPPRGRRPLIIVAALAGAILVGGTVAYGYKKLGLSEPQGDPPIIKSEAFPAKTKPADAGGKVFPYTDTKIMGRLGDGTPSNSTPTLPPASPDPSQTASADSADSSADDGGPRKVSTVVIGRDGSIQPPPDTGPAASSQVAVPGTSLVNALGQSPSGSPPAAESSGRDEPLPEPRQSKSVSGDDTPAPVKKAAPVKITKLNSVSKPSTASSNDDGGGDRAHSKKHLKKVARAESSTVSDAYDPSSPVTSSGAGSGYVAVLASIPHSSSSRMDALKRYADMQQKYSTALAGKTPDVAAANLGAKGRYDRLIVGPPGSRQEARNVCADLKTAGYTTCWVTSY